MTLPASKPAGWLLGLTIFTGAFLTFAVEPLLGKRLLPLFGGGPAVWAVCLLFFQVALVAGYVLGHALVSRLRPARRAAAFTACLLAALAVLPLAPERFALAGTGGEGLRVFLLLAQSAGLPFLVLTATGTLFIGWMAQAQTTARPHRFYALSNAGSLLALAAYPLLIEPHLSLAAQAGLWSAGFAAFALLAGLCAWRLAPVAEPASAAQTGPVVAWRTRALWITLPACASLLLLAVTNQLTQDVASVPFLWMLPLGLYLLSFILCFERDGAYRRAVFLPLLIIAGLLLCLLLAGANYPFPLPFQIATYSFALFVLCMACHGELARLKPGHGPTSGFYVAVAAGGALGGFCVAGLAPVVFASYLELPLGLIATLALLTVAMRVNTARVRAVISPYWLLAVALVVILLPGSHALTQRRQSLVQARNFFGSVRVYERDAGTPDAARVLAHGSTVHGTQFTDGARRSVPTTYYEAASGVGLVLRDLQARDRPLNLGVVGLGAGTLAAYGRAGDRLRMYEIDPKIAELADDSFTYLSDTPADIDLVMGDARLSLAAEPPQAFDALVLDAFSSDSIPVHLLTREALALYLQHVAPDGALLVHISNRHLDLEPVLARAAEDLALRASVVFSTNAGQGATASSWAVLTRQADLQADPLHRHGRPLRALDDFRAWTDQYSSLLPLLRANETRRP